MNLWARVAREIKFLTRLLRTLGRVSVVDRRADWLVCDEFEAAADRWPAREALRSETGSLTYAQLEALADGAARWAAAQGLQRGDCVALFMGNRLEYVPIWMGLSKLGIVTALINNHLEGAALSHCIDVAGAAHIITEARALDAVLGVRKPAVRVTPIWVLDLEAPPAPSVYRLTLAPAPRPPRGVRAAMTNRDTALLIYTSGTTGMPKAARITHARALLYTLGFAGSTGARKSDTLYGTLPLYHATGGLAALGAVLFNGGCFVMRRKFSASQFWDDVVRERCTIFVYIGELCRYLLNQPPHEAEQKHALRLAFGNGMRPEVWGPFVARFKIPEILEFYGSTEGNVSLFNFDEAPGAVGRIPFYVRKRFNVQLVKLDLETEQPLRGTDGLCQICSPGDIGETIGRIGGDVRSSYTGYVDRAASEKKILRDVMAKGDAWFRTGDLMRIDKDGYLYFVDRLGDTFRWRGENVSTTEVAAALSSCKGVAEANVYGVTVKGYDGRAGMAALITKTDFDPTALHGCVERALPSYARPLFIRVQSEIETTGTFKYRKVDLVREGFDPATIHDPMYFHDGAQKAYVPLTPALYAEIMSGAVRV